MKDEVDGIIESSSDDAERTVRFTRFRGEGL